MGLGVGDAKGVGEVGVEVKVRMHGRNAEGARSLDEIGRIEAEGKTEVERQNSRGTTWCVDGSGTRSAW